MHGRYTRLVCRRDGDVLCGWIVCRRVLPTVSSPAMPHRTSHRNRDRLLSALSRTALFVGAFWSVEPARAQTPSFTLEAALSAPFPSGLTTAPAGARVAWIFDAQGSRNIWVGEPGAG